MRIRTAAALFAAFLIAASAISASAFNYDVGFWLARSTRSYEVLADAAELAQIGALSSKDLRTGITDLAAFPLKVNASDMIEYLKVPELPKDLFLPDGSAAPAGAITQITARIKPAGTDTAAYYDVRYGVAVQRTDLRLLPASDRLMTKKSGGTDALQTGRLLPAEPVIVLYETTDRAWLLVQTARQRAWVPAQNIAFAFTKEHWMSFAGPQDFLTVLAPSYYMEQDPALQGISGMELPMGTRLPLVPDSSVPAEVKSRASADSYVALLPARRTDGRLNVTTVLIPRTADVFRGLLPVTGENILKQAMKLVGGRYGHKGYLGRDPFIMISDIFRCMGLEMPLTEAGYDAMPFAFQQLKGLSSDVAMVALRKAAPGSVIMLENGPAVYLGQYGEDVYAVAALSSVRVAPKSSTEFSLVESSVNGIALINLKGIYTESGNNFFIESRYYTEPSLAR